VLLKKCTWTCNLNENHSLKKVPIDFVQFNKKFLANQLSKHRTEYS